MNSNGRVPPYREYVRVKTRNNACAEIVSKVGRHYKVLLRGSPVAIADGDREVDDDRDVDVDVDVEVDGVDCFLAKKKELVFLDPDPDADEIMALEMTRKNAFERNTSLNYGEYDEIANLVAGHLLGDRCGYLISKHTDPNTLDGLPSHVEDSVLTLQVEQFYVLAGHSLISGKKMTSYTRTMAPFVSIEIDLQTPGKAHQALVKSGITGTGVEILAWFETLVLEAGPECLAQLFFRAFAFGLWRCDNRLTGDGDSLLDAFYVVFFAIQVMIGKGSSETIRSLSNVIKMSIDMVFQTHGERIHAYGMGKGGRMSWRSLLWCLCVIFLRLGFVVRDTVPERQYQIVLPNPYADTIFEQIEIATLGLKCREDHPASWYTAYQSIMDVKDLVLPERMENHLSNAFRFARRGKEVAFGCPDTFFSLVFLLIESFWVPTSLWPKNEAVTYKDICERFDQCAVLKKRCRDYTMKKYLNLASHWKQMLKAFLKSLGISSISEQGSILVSSIQFPPYMYCSFRFGGSYYAPGGKFDRLATKYTCSNCSTSLSTIKNCSRCGKENYCNRDCQKQHWKGGHKAVCRKKSSSTR